LRIVLVAIVCDENLTVGRLVRIAIVTERFVANVIKRPKLSRIRDVWRKLNLEMRYRAKQSLLNLVGVLGVLPIRALWLFQRIPSLERTDNEGLRVGIRSENAPHLTEEA
jgi:hypothetical protein